MAGLEWDLAAVRHAATAAPPGGRPALLIDRLAPAAPYACGVYMCLAHGRALCAFRSIHRSQFIINGFRVLWRPFLMGRLPPPVIPRMGCPWLRPGLVGSSDSRTVPKARTLCPLPIRPSSHSSPQSIPHHQSSHTRAPVPAHRLPALPETVATTTTTSPRRTSLPLPPADAADLGNARLTRRQSTLGAATAAAAAAAAAALPSRSLSADLEAALAEGTDEEEKEDAAPSPLPSLGPRRFSSRVPTLPRSVFAAAAAGGEGPSAAAPQVVRFEDQEAAAAAGGAPLDEVERAFLGL